MPLVFFSLAWQFHGMYHETQAATHWRKIRETSCMWGSLRKVWAYITLQYSLWRTNQALAMTAATVKIQCWKLDKSKVYECNSTNTTADRSTVSIQIKQWMVNKLNLHATQ
jgi:hypothetical protein